MPCMGWGMKTSITPLKNDSMGVRQSSTCARIGSILHPCMSRVISVSEKGTY